MLRTTIAVLALILMNLAQFQYSVVATKTSITSPPTGLLTNYTNHAMYVNLSNIEGIAIVVSDRLYNSLKYIKKIYDYLGIKYKIFKLSDVLIMFPHSNVYDSIRSLAKFVRNDLNFKYLLLLGDDVPFGYIYMKDGLEDVEGALKATDMYFSLLDFSWDQDLDGRLLECYDVDNDGLCEVVERLPDLIPDLIVGRLPISSSYELRLYVNTFVELISRLDFNLSILLSATLIQLPNELGNNSLIDGASILEDIVKDTLLNRSGIRIFRMYECEGVIASNYVSNLCLSARTFLSEVNRGVYDFIFMIAHGNGLKLVRKVWVSDDGDKVPEDEEISYPIIISYNEPLRIGPVITIYIDSCLVNAVDLLNDASLGKNLLTRGALTVIAPTRAIYYDLGGNPYMSDLLRFFMGELLSDYPEVDPAYAFYLSRGKYMVRHLGLEQDYKYLKNALTYTFLGDPILTKYVIKLREEALILRHNLCKILVNDKPLGPLIFNLVVKKYIHPSPILSCKVV